MGYDIFHGLGNEPVRFGPGKQNPYAEVFSPSRTILRPQLAVNAFEAVVNLLTPTAKRCPHLGCALNGIRMNVPGIAHVMVHAL